MRFSIRDQFLVPLVLLLLGLAGVCGWAAHDSARRAQDRVEHQVLGITHVLSGARFPLNQYVLEQMKDLSGAEFLLLDVTGERVATIAGDVGTLPPATPLSGETSDGLGDRIVIAGQAYFCRGVILRPPNAHPGAKLYILYPEALRDEAVWQAIRPTLILGATAGLAALILTLIGTRRLVKRIRDLDRRTRIIAAGDFSPMPLPSGRDELRDLAQSVNDMAEKLARFQEAATRSERERLLGQVAGGLAHQLRNAVTGARLAVQLHEQSCPGGDREALEVAERQLTRMGADLQRFFDVGGAGGRRKSCSLNDLVKEMAALLQPQCRHAHTELSLKLPAEPIVVMGDPGQLSHLILNLASNAVEAAGPGGRVEVCLRDEPGRAVLEVADSGPGPPPAIAARLFEPFVTGKSEGIGLGLAVAKQIAEGHGGKIAWRRDDRQTVFHVELPTTSY